MKGGSSSRWLSLSQSMPVKNEWLVTAVSPPSAGTQPRRRDGFFVRNWGEITPKHDVMHMSVEHWSTSKCRKLYTPGIYQFTYHIKNMKVPKGIEYCKSYQITILRLKLQYVTPVIRLNSYENVDNAIAYGRLSRASMCGIKYNQIRLNQIKSRPPSITV